MDGPSENYIDNATSKAVRQRGREEARKEGVEWEGVGGADEYEPAGHFWQGVVPSLAVPGSHIGHFLRCG